MDFLNGLMAPIYALFGVDANAFAPTTHFGQFILIVLMALFMVRMCFKLIKFKT